MSYFDHRIIKVKNGSGDIAVGNGEYTYTLAEVYYDDNKEYDFHMRRVSGTSVEDLKRAIEYAYSLPPLEVEEL